MSNRYLLMLFAAAYTVDVYADSVVDINSAQKQQIRTPKRRKNLSSTVSVHYGPDAPDEYCMFAPQEPCDDELVRLIDATQKDSEIHIMAYSFTAEKIISALARAAGRGVSVYIILDKSYEQNKSWSVLRGLNNVEVVIDPVVRIQHNKVMLIKYNDNSTMTIRGSYNWTYSAQYFNAENISFSRNNDYLYKRYSYNWHYRRNLPTTRPAAKL